MATGIKHLTIDYLLLDNQKTHWNFSREKLTEITLRNNQGKLSSSGCLSVDTGEFTGRSPQDRFVVYDDYTKDTVWWE
ncbi:MAG: phosphoenolpyruvate carboxykinase (ATP), partial [Flavobacteriales bacterium]|nr:phosphoenolpyruvate carboxykinase (ATP) [Flavobacteriales bacterium]